MESDNLQALKRDPSFRSKTQKNPEEKIEIDERFSKIVDHELSILIALKAELNERSILTSILHIQYIPLINFILQNVD